MSFNVDKCKVMHFGKNNAKAEHKMFLRNEQAEIDH